jgi:hypothetical protein
VGAPQRICWYDGEHYIHRCAKCLVPGDLNEETLDALRASPDVEYIAEDGIMHTMATQLVHHLLQIFQISESYDLLERTRHGVSRD